MSIYTILADSMNSNGYGAITLGQLIDTLAAADQDKVVADGFGFPHSWRGVYAFLAFDPKPNTTVAEMLAHARKAVGTTFYGWKGGSYTMNRDTPVFIAEDGSCDEETDPITPERMAKMLGVDVAEKTESGMPKRPGVAEAHHSVNGEWCVVIPDEVWDRFKAYVCELEAIAAKATSTA